MRQVTVFYHLLPVSDPFLPVSCHVSVRLQGTKARSHRPRLEDRIYPQKQTPGLGPGVGYQQKRGMAESVGLPAQEGWNLQLILIGPARCGPC
jgi:hypothetical protein